MSWLAKTDRFLGLNAAAGQAQWVYFGIPMDFTASFQPGSRFGPARVREASYGLETYSLAQDRDLEELSVADGGDVDLPIGNVQDSLDRITTTAQDILAQGQRFLAVGGEHLVTLPLMRAVVEKVPDVTVIHWDAHADLRDEYLGERYSHATVLRRVYELLQPGHLYQFGIRSATRDEATFARQAVHFHPDQVLEPLREALGELKGRPVYVTIDVDVVDPAYMPGTGTPEPGGISSAEALAAIRLFRELDVVSMDIVETMPANDISQRSAILTAKLVREALLAVCR